MTPEQIEFHRKRFEELMLKKGHGTHRHPRDYERYWNEHQQSQWEGYLMAIENNEIELPNYLSLSEGMDDQDIIARIIHNDCVNEFKLIIQSLGLKVKER